MSAGVPGPFASAEARDEFVRVLAQALVALVRGDPGPAPEVVGDDVGDLEEVGWSMDELFEAAFACSNFSSDPTTTSPQETGP